VICGETKRSEEVKEENYFRIGRQYGRFQRSFPLPQESIDAKGIKAAFKDGILKVTVPLKESIKGKEKPIEVEIE
jgi:HSP20 family protein